MYSPCSLSITCLLREASSGYQLSKEEGKIDRLLLMGDVKLYGSDGREIDSLVQTVRIFTNDVGMGFSINKCAVFVMM